ncbi:hypothetical protein HDC36_000587 [Xanthomonas sp. JAI131]|jgi:hypothetical protein|uniref:hypothetical protein n=1 Tax=unclassified Xanthomonas TaxID=2643310 RepID=UPI0015C717B5|nr:hypothetical protein [Xanthomonas sp. JAI131]NYF19150.1 hypothetical protein [Xanthomonas sp. JAI131]
MNPVFAALGMMLLTVVALIASELSKMVDKIVAWMRHSAMPRKSAWQAGRPHHPLRPRRR